MQKQNHVILGVHVTDRMKQVGGVQKLFSDYGHHIKTRLGLHQVSEEGCSSAAGLIILEMVGEEKGSRDLQEKLNAIEGVEAKLMVFEHH